MSKGPTKTSLFYSLKTLEKLFYLAGVPTLLAYSGYTLYKKAE
jgi:hypothetical protein